MILTTAQLLTLRLVPGLGRASTAGFLQYLARLEGGAPASAAELWELLRVFAATARGRLLSLPAAAETEGKAGRVLEIQDRLGIRVLGCFDDDFPPALHGAERAFLSGAPTLLFLRGNAELLQRPGVAVIGSRACTKSAAEAGERLAETLAGRGIVVISGLAEGCDTCAHEGALKAGGSTVAVLAHGLDTVHPTRNAPLAKAIVEQGGLLVSEYAAGERPTRYRFIERDHLQAGLSLATVVIQSAVNGGSMHAANAALRAGRPLFAVMYDDEETARHENFQGNLALLARGARGLRADGEAGEISSLLRPAPAA